MNNCVFPHHTVNNNAKQHDTQWIESSKQTLGLGTVSESQTRLNEMMENPISALSAASPKTPTSSQNAPDQIKSPSRLSERHKACALISLRCIRTKLQHLGNSLDSSLQTLLIDSHKFERNAKLLKRVKSAFNPRRSRNASLFVRGEIGL